MGIKGFIIILLLVLTVIFSFQNLQNITLVFFAANPISLPLSLAILLFVFAGLISSLVIYFLSNVSVNKSPDIREKNKRSPISPPPTSEEYNLPKKERIKQEYVNQEDEEFQEKIEQNRYINQKEKEIINQEDILDNNFSKHQENLTRKNINYQEPKIKEEEGILQPIQSDKEREIENIPDSDLGEKNDENFISPEELMTKPRQAAPYTYQPKEKTEIFPDNDTSKRKKVVKKRQGTEENIYNAPYRVITPANEEDSRRYQPDNNDDDWDF